MGLKEGDEIMSPKVFVGKDLIAELTEEKDLVHGSTIDGHRISVDLRAIDAASPFQHVIVTSDILRGREGLGRSTESGARRIEVSNRLGSGVQILPDGRSLTVELENAPIRQLRRGPDGTREMWQHPRWVR